MRAVLFIFRICGFYFLIKVGKRVQNCPWLKYVYKEVRYECQISFVATKLATVDGDNANGIKSGGNISDQICVTFDKSLSRICIKRFTMFSCAVRRVCLKLKVTLFSLLEILHPLFLLLLILFHLFPLQMPALRLSVSLLLVLLLDVLANACFTCNTSGRKKREAATGEDDDR